MEADACYAQLTFWWEFLRNCCHLNVCNIVGAFPVLTYILRSKMTAIPATFNIWYDTKRRILLGNTWIKFIIPGWDRTAVFLKAIQSLFEELRRWWMPEMLIKLTAVRMCFYLKFYHSTTKLYVICSYEELFSLKNNLSKALLVHYKQVTF